MRLDKIAVYSALSVVAATSSLAASSSRSINPLLLPTAEVSNQPLLSDVINIDESLENCVLSGQIDDADCDYETVEESINTSNFFQTLSSLVKEKYFRYYKVDLYKDCPFWNENSLCMSRDCTVSKIDESQIPVEYRTACLSSLKTTDEALVLPQEASMSSAVNLKSGTTSSGTKDATCQCAETDFCHWEDEEWSPESLWVDLIDNPERFTGYSGPGAHNVWRQIYEENCFGLAKTSPSYRSGTAATTFGRDGIDSSMQESRQAAEAFSSLLHKQPNLLGTASASDEQCLEKRVFYKLISGMHASISIHICNDYLDRSTGEWKPNLQCFIERIAQHPERLQNVYFIHVVLTRALAKLAERIGMNRSEDLSRIDSHRISTDEMLSRLAPGLPIPPVSGALGRLLQQSLDSPPTFDEASMFDKSNPESEFLRREFRDRFRNVSRIMDCVGCDKCRLWGKLQVNGLGTALKILFEGSNLNPNRILQRSELVALINTVHRVAESIRAVEYFRDSYQAEPTRATIQEQRSPERLPSLQSPPNRQQSYKTAAQSRATTRINMTTPSPYRLASRSTKVALRHSIAERVKCVLDKGLHACESQWRKCLSWWMTIFDYNHQDRSKSEL